jgi:hypothetical protein
MKKLCLVPLVSGMLLLAALTFHQPASYADTPPRPDIFSRHVTVPPVIDGNPAEWAEYDPAIVLDTPTYPIQTYVYFVNDSDYLYVLVDAVDDVTDGPGCDEVLLEFNSFPTTDIEAGIQNGEILTDPAPLPVGSQVHISFRGSFNTITPHRIYELRIPRDYIGAGLGAVVDFSSPSIKAICGEGASLPYDGTDGTLWRDNIYPHWLDWTEINTYARLYFDERLYSDPRSGWWYTASEPGTGISMEIEKDKLFMAWYIYDQEGRPVWLTSHGALTGGSHFSGNLYAWTGWPLGEAYSPPSSEKVGEVEIDFTGSDQAAMSWTYNGREGQKSITRFMDAMSPGQKNLRDITGWWWSPSYNGMGIFMEAQGGNVFVAWYHYRDDGSPRWWSFDQNLALDANGFSGTFKEWSDGQCIGCDHRPPTAVDTEETVIFTFQQDGKARLTWSGPTLVLERFYFEHME